jgi:hypothetical protein
VRDRHKHERQQKKIECVEGPAEKTGEERLTLSAVEQFEEPNRFHSVFQLFAWLLYRKLESQEATIDREVTAVLLEMAEHSPQQRLYNFALSVAPAWLASTKSSKGR